MEYLIGLIAKSCFSNRAEQKEEQSERILSNLSGRPKKEMHTSCCFLANKSKPIGK